MVALFPFVGTGQTYFNELLPDTHLFAFGNIVPFEDGYVANGAGFNPTYRTFFVYRFDSKGQLQWYQPFGVAPKLYFGDVINPVLNGFTVAGSVRDSVGAQTDFFVTRLDSEGKEVWLAILNPTPDDVIKDAIVIEQDVTVIAGTARLNGSDYDYYVGAVDSAGEKLWERNYGNPSVFEECRSVIQTNDGGFVLSGVKGPTGKWDIWVIRTDSAGEVIWQKNHGSNFHDYGGHAALTNDGNMAMAYATTETGATEGSQLVVSKIDIESGDTLFRKQYQQFIDAFSMTKPVVNSDGTMVIAGGLLHQESGRPIGLVIKTSPSGDLIWSREYFTREDIDEYIYDIKPTPDSGYVFCGSAFDENKEQRGWIVKLDCHGNDSITYYEPDSACVVYSNITYYQSPVNEEIKVFPNPATDYVTVEFPEGLAVEAIELINATGQTVLRKTLPVSSLQHQLPTANYPNGMYWLKLKIVGGVCFMKKLFIHN